MSESSAEVRVETTADQLFDYLSQVSNLPEYFPRMTSAEAVDGGEAVTTTARLDDGTEVEGEAWFRVDDEARTIEWGSEGDNDYHGELEVTTDSATASRVTVTIHTERDVADDDLEGSLREVAEKIKSIMEG